MVALYYVSDGESILFTCGDLEWCEICRDTISNNFRTFIIHHSS